MKTDILFTPLFFTFFFLSIQCSAQTENYWTKKADFTGLKRERAIAFTVDDFAYIGTGVDTAEFVHKDFWKYDPIVDVWVQVADIPGTARRNASAFSIGGFGYVGTGIDNADANFGSTLSDFWKYDPATNNWSSIANLPGSGIYFATGFSIGDKGYICGGKKGPNWYASTLFEYNPTSNSWTSKASFPGGVRYQLSSFVIDDLAYVGFGVDQDLFRKDIWQYNPVSNSWIARANLPASERGSSHTFTLGQRGFVCMGSNGGMLDDLWEYNPFTDDWTSRATYDGSSRKNGVYFALNGKGYVGTGKGFSGKKLSMYEYTPNAILGLNDTAVNKIHIYPNPTKETINIHTTSNKIVILEIFTSYGTKVLKTAYINEINIAHLPVGIYILIGKDEAGEILSKEKLIIQ
jgi:N-acetylneuraminic acid mutarotase